jgi:hypothetical protein
MRHRRLTHPVHQPSLAFAGFRFPPVVILLAVRWYLRYGPSYRDLEELLAERGIEVDHVTLFRWVRALHPSAGGGGSTLPPHRRWSLVRGRDLGATSIERSTTTARSATCSCPRGGT